jgi:predicted RNA-binding Zn-ribbon protein involved in translation (DUF1610 family)
MEIKEAIQRILDKEKKERRIAKISCYNCLATLGIDAKYSHKKCGKCGHVNRIGHR